MPQSIFSLIILFWVVFVLVKKAKNSQQNTARRPQGPGGPVQKKRPGGYTNYRPHKDIVSVSRDMGDSKGSILRDDKANDWLAQQLREEHRAFKLTSEMFDLKIEHASHCDARLIEQFHRRHCDAEGIDLANGSTLHKN